MRLTYEAQANEHSGRQTRHTDTQTDRHRQIDRQDIQTHRQTDRQTDTDRQNKQTQTETESRMRFTYRAQANEHSGRQTRHTDRQTDRQTQTDKQTDRQTDRQRQCDTHYAHHSQSAPASKCCFYQVSGQTWTSQEYH